MTVRSRSARICGLVAAGLPLAALPLWSPAAEAQAPAKRPNIIMLMTDDTGRNDFGAYSGGGAALGHERLGDSELHRILFDPPTSDGRPVSRR